MEFQLSTSQSPEGWRKHAERLRLFLVAGPERELRFRSEIYALSRRSVRVCCGLGIAIIICYLAIAVLAQGRKFAWTDGLNPHVSVLDKLFLLVVIGSAFLTSFTKWGQRSARLIVGTGMVMIGLIETTFDLMNAWDMSFTTPWLAVILMTGIGTMPFRASQALLVGIAMFLVYPGVLILGPSLFGWPELRPESSQLTFMAIIVLLGTGVSGALYRNRYRSFRHQENLRHARDRELIQTREIERQHSELTRAYDSLKTTQAQLIQSEKLASLGQLTSGIAHELKNPLNFVNNFAELNEELAQDMMDDLSVDGDRSIGEVRDGLSELALGLKKNSSQIVRHGRRADEIVKTMMEHAQTGKGERCEVEVNKLMDEYVILALRGFQVREETTEIAIERAYDESVGSLEIVPQELGRALINLLNNAFASVAEKAGASDGTYTPRILVSTRRNEHEIELQISDNGVGVPVAIRDRIFEPFYTTKPPGGGHTGLGLSLSHDIVTQGHNGSLKLMSGEAEGATFVITLPC